MRSKEVRFPTRGIYLSLVFAVMKLMGAVEWSWAIVGIPFCLDAALSVMHLVVSALICKTGK